MKRASLSPGQISPAVDLHCQEDRPAEGESDGGELKQAPTFPRSLVFFPVLIRLVGDAHVVARSLHGGDQVLDVGERGIVVDARTLASQVDGDICDAVDAPHDALNAAHAGGAEHANDRQSLVLHRGGGCCGCVGPRRPRVMKLGVAPRAAV